MTRENKKKNKELIILGIYYLLFIFFIYFKFAINFAGLMDIMNICEWLNSMLFLKN